MSRKYVCNDCRDGPCIRTFDDLKNAQAQRHVLYGHAVVYQTTCPKSIDFKIAYFRRERRVKKTYQNQKSPRLVILARRVRRSHGYAGCFNVQKNHIQIRPHYSMSPTSFLGIYLHELAHWIQWNAMETEQERKALHYMYGTACRKYSHDDRFLEKMAEYAVEAAMMPDQPWHGKPLTLTQIVDTVDIHEIERHRYDD